MGGKSAARAQATAQTNAARLQSNAAIQVAGMQSDAALKAAQMGADGAFAAAGMVAHASQYGANLQFEASEKAIAEQKRQFDTTTEMLSPYVETGTRFLEDVNEASTLEGFADRLRKISDTDIYSDLVNDRQAAASGALGQSGLTRSGAAAQQAADISTQLAMAIEGQDYSRKVNQVNVGQAAAARQANINMGYAGSVSNILTGTAQGMSNTIVQGAGQSAGYMNQGSTAAAQGVMNAAYYGGQGIMGSANAIGAGMINSANAMMANRQNNNQMLMSAASTAANIFFSDERLKDNMQPVGEVGGLTLYEWDWKPAVKDMVGMEMTTGFKAQEVESKYPDCVSAIGDYKVIDYTKLRKQIKEGMRAAA